MTRIAGSLVQPLWRAVRPVRDQVAQDSRLVPAAAGVWAAVLGVVSWGSGGLAVAGVIAAGLLAAGARLRRASLLAAGVLALIVSGAALIRVQAADSSPVRALAQQEASGWIVVRLTADARFYAARGPRPDFATRNGELRAIDARGRSWRLAQPVVLMASGPHARALRDQLVGTVLGVRVRLSAPDPGSREVAVARIVGEPRMLSPPGPLDRQVEAIRAGLRQSVAAHPPERRGLVPALVVGDTSNFPDELADDFDATALTHLTAVSGANLTLMLAFLLTLTRWCGVRGWWLRVTGLLGVLAFIALCRTEPSVLRAAAMGLVGLAGLGLSAGRRGLRPLSVAVIGLLAIDPWLAAEAGFALSVLATGGIVWWSGAWAHRLGSWMPRPLAEALAVPLAAQVATQPVVTAISGQISVVGLLTNAAAGVLVGPATVAGFAAAALSVVHPAPAAVAGFIAAWCAQGIIFIGVAGASLPGAAVGWPADPASIAVLTVACALVGACAGAALGRRWLCLVLAVALILLAFRGPAVLGWPPGEWQAVACDVGQGDAFAIRVGPGSAIVVDAGLEPGPIDRCLRDLGVDRIPLLILSHGHADHVGGLAGAVDGRRVGTVLTSAASTESEPAIRLARAADATARAAAAGDVLSVGSATVEVLGPTRPRQASGWTLEENDASLLVRIRTPGGSVLFTGDLEPDGQARAVRSGVDLRADVLKVPHHASARQDERFLAATGARLAIVSVGADNPFGHPAPSAMRTLNGLGMTVARTDTQGAVAVTGTPGRLALIGQRLG